MTKNLQQLPLPFPPLNSSNPNPDQSRTKIVWIRRLENRRIYAPFEYLKLRNWMIGPLLRCFFIIIIRHRRRRSCLPTGNCFDLRFTFMHLWFFSRYPAHDIPLWISVFPFFFSVIPASFKLKLSLSFFFFSFDSVLLAFLSIDIRHHLHSIQRL